LAVLAASLLLFTAAGGCGFKLRGQFEIPPELNPIFIMPQAGSAVGNAIVQHLKESKVELAARRQDARMILRISNESTSSRVIAVDRNGKALATELRYGLGFDAVSADGKQLVSYQTIEVVRTYEDPEVEVLGKQLESESIRGDMISDAATRILNRLRAALM
jgi:LPS-assembly lipoprotein